ncbi:MAG TPA: FCD domain-containing protein, partial [Alphaproteobacteria bacterium]|nr:FCD domain-containing protein [Alphaproteobacteria bacterium]
QTRLRRFMEYQFGEDRRRMELSCREHLAIIEALESGNREAAARLMREHIAIARDLRPAFG